MKQSIKPVMIFLAAVMLTACGNDETGGDNRVVSLVPSNTEILAEMGMADDLAAVTTEADYPPEVVDDEDLVRLNALELDEEQLTALDPTHILSHASLGGVNEDIINRVAETTGAEILVVEDAQNIEGIYESIRQIGEFVGETQAAESVISRMAEEIGDLISQYAGREENIEAFIHISDQPEIYTSGEGTFIHHALEVIGVGNTFDDLEGFPSVSAEDVVERDPDLVISVMGLDDRALETSIRETPGFEGLKISQPANQCNINPDLLSRPGPRIVEGLAEAGQCVYE